MSPPKLYMMALYATRPAPDKPGTAEHEVSLRAGMIVAGTNEEAMRKGLVQLLEWCPPGDGWVGHHVTLDTLPREKLLGVLEASSDDSSGEENNWPELLM